LKKKRVGYAETGGGVWQQKIKPVGGFKDRKKKRLQRAGGIRKEKKKERLLGDLGPEGRWKSKKSRGGKSKTL